MSTLINSPKTTNEGLLSRDDLVPFCIARRDCQKRFCMCDLLDMDLRRINPKMYLTTLMICGKCYKEIHKEYVIFSGKVKELRYHFMDDYIAVKIYLMLNKLRSEFKDNECECGRKDCNLHNLTKEERKIIKEKFDLMYQVFGTPSCLT